MEYRICPQPLLINSSNPEEEVWHHIDLLSSHHYTLRLLEDRVKGNFFGFGEYIDRLHRTKLIYCSDNYMGKEQIEIYEKLTEHDDLHRNTTEIVSLTKQAIELYKSSKQASMYSRPITLYYSYAKLARILYLSTYKSKQAIGKHGITLKDNQSIICLRTGAFARFHDSYNGNPSIYLMEHKFRWEELINESQMTKIFPLMLNMKNCNIVELYENKYGATNKEHELTREILFVYAMSMLARYKVEKWGNLIENKDSNAMWRIKEYLTSTQLIFPNLIFNQLHGKQYYFYPSEPTLMSFTEVKPQRLDWIL
ncbi:MAG: YaaC family protein [Nitrososphaera sp.]